MPVEGRELHSNGLSEDTSTVLRNGGIDGTKFERRAEISATTSKPEFTSLYHLINAKMLMGTAAIERQNLICCIGWQRFCL